jgi:hypothetical protein
MEVAWKRLNGPNRIMLILRQQHPAVEDEMLGGPAALLLFQAAADAWTRRAC